MFKEASIAAIGDKDSMLAFRAVGALVIEAATPEGADAALKRLAKEQYGIIFITEALAAGVTDTLAILKTRPTPAVVAIPTLGGKVVGYGQASLKKDIERAIAAHQNF